jgi:hypothetical protein
MSNRRLQYYIHDDSDALRLELAGSLSGAGAQSVYQAWRTALSIIGGRPLVIDITFVTEADELGLKLVEVWHRSEVRIITVSPESRALVQPILGQAMPAPAPKQNWLRQLSRQISGNLANKTRRID